MDNDIATIQIAKFQLQASVLLIQAVELSDFDKDQGRKRNPDGTWAKSPESLSKTTERLAQETGKVLDTYLGQVGKQISNSISDAKKQVLAAIKNSGAEDAVLNFLKKIDPDDFILPALKTAKKDITDNYAGGKKALDKLAKDLKQAYNKSSLKDVVDALDESVGRFLNTQAAAISKECQNLQSGQGGFLGKALTAIIGGGVMAVGAMYFLGGISGFMGAISFGLPAVAFTSFLSAMFGSMAMRYGIKMLDSATKRPERLREEPEVTRRLREENEANKKEREIAQEEFNKRLDALEQQYAERAGTVVDIDLKKLTPQELNLVRKQVDAYKSRYQDFVNSIEGDNNAAKAFSNYLKETKTGIDQMEKELSEAEKNVSNK